MNIEYRISMKLRKHTGTWQAVIYFPPQNGRKHVRRTDSLGVTREDDAVKAFDAWKRTRLEYWLTWYRAGVQPNRGHSRTLVDLVRWHLEKRLPVDGLTPKTIDSYRVALSRFLEFCDERGYTSPNDIDAAIVLDWQQWLAEHYPLKSGRPQRPEEVRRLRRFFNDLLDFSDVAVPAIRWRVPGRPDGSHFRALSLRDLHRFLETMAHDAPGIALECAWLANSGWRLGELFALEDAHIDPSGLGIRFDRQTKTETPLITPLPPILLSILEVARARWITPGPIFRHPDGHPWTKDTFAGRLRRASRQHFGAPVCARDLRVTYETLLSTIGAPVRVAADLAGHKDPTVTVKHYQRPDVHAMQQWSSKITATITSPKLLNDLRHDAKLDNVQ